MTGYLRLTWAPALVSVVLTVLVLAVLFRGSLTAGYPMPARSPVADPVLFRTAVAVCLLLGPAFVTGVPVA